MDDKTLIHFISGYGSRKGATWEEVTSQTKQGASPGECIYTQLKRLQMAGLIEVKNWFISAKGKIILIPPTNSC